ncbi:MAG: RluA family pseudouridine synthase [Oscillospiraceae bacterium]|nr:RluA family pseudouridine synthase [Oscillospiraceae bacterium]
MKEFTIGRNDAGQRLDRFVAKVVPGLPASLAQKYIRIKRIKVGGRPVKRDYKLELGDVVSMYVNDGFFDPQDTEALPLIAPKLDIVYQDDNILLINKATGVECQDELTPRIRAYLQSAGTWNPRAENSFAPALCNRIDRNTSGIVIAAKNAEALRIISEKIKLREIDKYYLAVVHGTPSPSTGRLTGFIFKDAKKNQVYVSRTSRPGSKSAVMEYRTIVSNNGPLSLVECNLITGRTHQIRAQMADFGHPLLGDGKYGSERLNKPYGERKQALCSYKLVFAFKTDAGALQYLNKQEFQIKDVAFVKKYFGTVPLM